MAVPDGCRRGWPSATRTTAGTPTSSSGSCPCSTTSPSPRGRPGSSRGPASAVVLEQTDRTSRARRGPALPEPGDRRAVASSGATCSTLALPFPRLHTVTQLHDHWLAMCAVGDWRVRGARRGRAGLRAARGQHRRRGGAHRGWTPLGFLRRIIELGDTYEGGHSFAQCARACQVQSFELASRDPGALSERAADSRRAGLERTRSSPRQSQLASLRLLARATRSHDTSPWVVATFVPGVPCEVGTKVGDAHRRDLSSRRRARLGSASVHAYPGSSKTRRAVRTAGSSTSGGRTSAREHVFDSLRRPHLRLWLADERRARWSASSRDAIADRVGVTPLRRHVQRHHRSRDRDPRARTDRRGHRPALHVRRHRSRAALAGHHAGLRGHRPGDPHPRPGARRGGRSPPARPGIIGVHLWGRAAPVAELAGRSPTRTGCA